MHNMKGILIGAAFAAVTGGAFAAEKVIFSEDFAMPEALQDHWVQKVQGGKTAAVVDGRLRNPKHAASLRWSGNVPFECSVEMKLALYPKWGTPNESREKGWAGIYLEGGGHFAIRANGGTFLLGNGYNNYVAIPGYEDGKFTTLKVVRCRRGKSSAGYTFFVNGLPCGEFFAPMPTPKVVDGKEVWPQPEIFANDHDIEVDDFIVNEQAPNDSPNLIANSGFEYDDEGVIPMFSFQGDFDWPNRPFADYENIYLKRFMPDTAEKHSGKQSLRILVNGASRWITFYPAAATLAVAGKPGVLSVWMKTSLPEMEVEIHYGKGKQVFQVDGEWKRYEVVSPEPFEKQNWLSRPVGFQVRNPSRYDGILWLDDMQAEAIEGEIVEGKTYATPWKPVGSDAVRFAKKELSPIKPGDRGETKPTGAAENALRGYVLKDGESLVLADRNFHMEEKTARFRVWDGKGGFGEAPVDISALPCGPHKVSFQAIGREWSADIVKRAPKEGATQIDFFSRGLVHDGKKIVHSGVCLLTSREWTTPDGRLRTLDFLKERGFNTVHFTCFAKRQQQEKAKKAIAQAKELGLDLVLWVGEDEEFPSDELAKSLYDTNILSLMVLDEPDLRLPGEKAREYLNHKRALFPYTPVQMNNGVKGVAKGYASLATDIFMIDDYLTNAEGRSVYSIIGGVDTLVRARAGTPSWYFVVGTNDLHYRQPAFAEQTVQCWGTICSGGSGISWFVMMPTATGNWKAIEQFNKEVQQLSPIILSDELCGAAGADVGTDKLRAITRKYKENFFVFACNMDRAALDQVTFTLPADAPQNGTVSVLFENRTLPVKNGTFSDDFAGHTRHLYRLAPAK